MPHTIKRTDIIEKLANRGYNAEEHETVKNGVILEGIRIKTDTGTDPVIYTEELIKKAAEEENITLDDITSKIIGIYERNKLPDFDVDQLLERDYILSYIYIALQKTSTENIEKKACDLEGIESYLYIRGDIDKDGYYSVKVSKFILELANISECEAWEKAEEHTNAETTIINMAKAMCSMMNMEYSEEMEEIIPFYIMTNTSKIKGASAILNKKALAEFGKKHNTDKIAVLPSSVHEMLLTPYTQENDIDNFSEMVKAVNSTEVDPTERLTDRAYIITL